MANLENKKSLSAKVTEKITEKITDTRSEDETSLWELFWFAIAFVLIFSLIVNASTAEAATSASVQTSTSKSAATSAPASARLKSKIEVKKGKDKTWLERFSSSVSLEYGTSLQPGDAYERNAALAMSFLPNFEINKDYKLALKSGVTKDLTSEEQKTVFDNTKISLIQTATPLSQIFSIRPAVAVVAPTHTDADKTFFQGSIGGAGRLLFDLKPVGILFNGYYNLAYDRNFHEYTTDVDGTSNFQHALTQVLLLEVPFAENWSISATSVIVSAWTYRGTVRNFFELSQDLEYKIDDSFSVNLGHTNEGDAYKANGQSSNMAFFNGQSSVLRIGVGYEF